MSHYVEKDCSYCTLFNSAYLDRGLAMLHSLINNSADIRIYVLAMDRKTFEVLNGKFLDKVTIIQHDDFATKRLLELKTQRNVAEYCWTCTAKLIEYIFENYNERMCTYIDADLYFYQNPYCLIEEMIQAKCSVQIVEHRFGKGIFATHMRRYSGIFCVQFNTFENTCEARMVLKTWRRQCMEHCSSEQDGKTLGDQKYLEEWPSKYKCVHILKNEGGGLAPWNIFQYRGKRYSEDGAIEIENKYSKELYQLIFYHFHGMELKDDGTSDIGVFTRNIGIDKSLVNMLYRPYIKKLQNERKSLGNNFEGSIQVKVLKKQPIRKRIKERKILENFWEKLYCRIRAELMKTRKSKDVMRIF